MISIIIKQIKETSKISIALILFSLIVYVFSLTLPVLYIDTDDFDSLSNGFNLLVVGPFCLVFGGALDRFIFWTPNGLFFITIVLIIQKDILALLASFLAFSVSLGFSFMTEITINEAGTTAKILSFDWGYKWWVVSMLCIFITTLVDFFIIRKIPLNQIIKL